MKIRKWNMPKVDRDQVMRLVEESNSSQIVANILAGRGYLSDEEAKMFGEKDAPLCNPFLMKDMDKAVQRIMLAVEEGEMIAIYGDYDCDGITATAMLYSYLQDLGARVMYYIPDRDTEGYGLNNGALDKLNKQDVNLIITVDNGISAIEEVAYAKELDIDVVITDHHHPREIVPSAQAVINPHQEDCPYPFKALCGAGVAFKLICAMEGDETCEEMLLHYGSLVAVATVGDVVELTGENRTLVKSGIESISNCENLGLNALIEIGGLAKRPVNSTSLAFGLVPRINAAGRMGEATRAVELLLCEDENDAASLAEEIEGFNIKRKELVLKIFAQIEEKIAETPALIEDRIIIISGEGWHHGVIGIAASKVVEKYAKPVILISTNGDEARGSARSVMGYSIIEAISRCSRLLSHYGGHNQAAGISLKSKDIPEFVREIQADAFERFDIMPVDEIKIDAELALNSLSLDSINELEILEPFGCGNEEPTIALTACRVEGIIPMSGNKHIRLRLSQNKQPFQAVYFGMPETEFAYKTGDLVDVAARLEANEYNGETKLSIKIKDIRPNGIKQDKLIVGRQYYEKYKRHEKLEQKIIDYISPTREDIAKVYRLLKQENGWKDGYDLMWCSLGGLNYCKMRLCIDVMQELGLFEDKNNKNNNKIFLNKAAGKVDLEKSEILKKLKAGEGKW